MSAPELLPCPFCGGDGHFQTAFPDTPLCARCSACALTAEKWNRRALTDEMVERGARALAWDHAVGSQRTLDQVHEHVETKWGRYEREARCVLEAALSRNGGPDAS